MFPGTPGSVKTAPSTRHYLVHPHPLKLVHAIIHTSTSVLVAFAPHMRWPIILSFSLPPFLFSYSIHGSDPWCFWGVILVTALTFSLSSLPPSLNTGWIYSQVLSISYLPSYT